MADLPVNKRQPLIVVPIALGGYEAWECPWPVWAQRPKEALVFNDKEKLMKFLDSHFEEWKFATDFHGEGNA